MGDVAVLQIVAQFGGGHHGAVGLAFGGTGAQVRRAVHTLDAQQFLSREVAEVLRHLAGVHGVQQGLRVHQLAAGKVQHAHAVLAHRKGLGVDGVAGRGQVGNMDGQVVAAGQHIAQRHAVLYAAGQAPCCVDRNVGVIAQHFHAQCHGGVGHTGTDGTQADNAQRFAAQFRADKLLLALFHILGNGLAAFQALGPLDGVDHVAAARN